MTRMIVLFFNKSNCQRVVVNLSQIIKRSGVFSFFGFKSVYKELRFRDGLVWTVGLTEGMKLVFKFVDGAINVAVVTI